MSEQQLGSLAKALEADRSAFREIADAIPNFIWLTRADGGAEFFNRALRDYIGLREGENPSKAFYALLHPAERADLLERWQKALSEGRGFETEFRIRPGSTQAYRWHLTHAVPLRDADGRIVFWIGSSTDIDVQKRATENLHFVIAASDLLVNATTIADVCSQFAQIAVERFADWCFVLLADPVERYKIVALSHRDPEKVRFIETFRDRYPAGEDPLLDRLLDADKPMLYERISDEQLRAAARDPQHLEILRGMQFYSAIVAPLRHGGELLGGVFMYSSESRRQFDENDVDVLQTLTLRAAARIAAMRALSEEQRARRRLQFIASATQAVYESFDLTTAFGNLTRILVSEIGDMAAVFRLEEGSAARVVAASHRDAESDDLARSFVGIRALHTEAEKRFVQRLQARRPLAGTRLLAGTLAKTVWPYLSDEVAALAPKALVTVPLHSRGKVYGAIVVYYAQNGRDYKPGDLEVLTEIGAHASVALENADVFERERRMSETLQDSLLPPSLPRVPGLSFDAVYLPSATEAQVGGDWYDAFDLEDGTIVVTAGDVTGRGANAAVIMGKVRHLLSIAPSYERDPARILDTVESVLARRYPDAIVTAFLGFIDPQHASIRYANAGHPAPLLRRAGGGIEELRAEGLPLGLRRESQPVPSRVCDLTGARMLVLYTDGLTESGHDVLGGYERLREVVARDALLHTHGPARFIEESCLGSAASDDVAVLTISFESGIRWSFDAENAKAAQDARGEFVEYLRLQSADADSVQIAELVFGELVGNVVRHAPGAIDIDLEWSNGTPTLHVLDRGQAFNAPGDLPEDMLSESGRGLFIVRQLSESLDVEHVPGYGNHVRVDLPVRRKHE